MWGMLQGFLQLGSTIKEMGNDLGLKCISQAQEMSVSNYVATQLIIESIRS